LRRLFVHESIYDGFVKKMVNVYPKFLDRMGDPLDENTLMGPLHAQSSVDEYFDGIKEIKA